MFAGTLIALGVGWRGLFFWPACVVAIIAAAVGIASRDAPQAVIPGVRFGRNAGTRRAELHFDSGASGRSAAIEIVKSLMRLRSFQKLLVYSFLIHILRSFFMYWIPKFMVDMGMGSAAAGMSSAVFRSRAASAPFF